MEIGDLRASFASSTEKAAQEKESLKKATRAQKQRAERFEAAIEKVYDQLKEKDAQLTRARLERDSRRQQKEREAEEKDKLVVHIELLKSQVAEAAARLQKETDELNAANDIVMQRVERLVDDKAELDADNATLKATVAQLEQRLADSESALTDVTVVSDERKHQAEQSRQQVGSGVIVSRVLRSLTFLSLI
ncbi:Outer dense fiber protein 2-like [Liparis tanakae]|uniref:Outer dense fiber protein 2-like n=1 Tax=Liparis tanakae TaxID=230148 RepID=A0A4Z2E5Y5_9TELE|nr:Outer dense fiber protein 2-like [Liparis tanakae]